MIPSRRFRLGGLRPHLRAVRGLPEEIWNTTLPPALLVPMAVRGQRPAICLVKEGDIVREGMVIGASDTSGVPVHSPVPGVVREIRKVQLPGIGLCEAVYIDLEGEFEHLGRSEKVLEWEGLEAAGLLKLIHSAGVIEVSRPQTGLLDSLRTVRRSKARRLHILVAGFDQDPLCLTESTVLARFPEELATGLDIISRIIPGAYVSFGYHWSSRKGAWRSIKAAARRGIRCRPAMLRDLYPQADDTLLVDSLLGRELPDISSANEQGVLCISPSTLYAVCQAVLYRRPLIERLVTVSGGAIRRPRVLKARIGMNIAELIKECGGFIAEPGKIVLGDSFRGASVSEIDTPVNKDTCAVLALSREEVNEAAQMDCIQCGLCSQSCPSGLDPMRLYKMLERAYPNHALAEGLESCTLCGICSSVCPARIPLTQRIRSGLEQINE